MKIMQSNYGTKLFLLVSAIVTSVFVSAQDSTAVVSKTSVTSTTNEEIWYMQPWAWAAGAAVLLVIILLAVKGSNSSKTTDKVTVTKTVTRDTDQV